MDPRQGSQPVNKFSYLGVDYKTLEERALAKIVNFGHAYWMGPSKISDLLKWNQCKHCDAAYLPHGNGRHPRIDCLYRRMQRRYKQLGYLPFAQFGGKTFRRMGVRVHKGVFDKQTRKENEPLTRVSYIPAWAAVLLYDSKLKKVSGGKKKTRAVRQFWALVRKVAQDPDEQIAIAGEHILQNGVHRQACQAFIERTRR